MEVNDQIQEIIEYIKFCESVLSYEEDLDERYNMIDAIWESKQELLSLGYPEDKVEDL